MLARTPKPGLSFWLAIASFVLTAIMVHPGLAALLAMGVNVVLLAGVRAAARLEGLRAGMTLSNVRGAGDRAVGR
ncbi:hypothetical protein [Methylobacterium sp. WL120]|uniref:hypothetical protein n=1 Tax=Methylobacterium sp. WL120 TaxID=2603887 RepID=UPI0011CA1E6F|nr:hypothetical protein [Methylobacterium sp. WL120]TXM65752.1 hypothetical protein FV229_14760 [Methylobacterium sp. WL120]